MAKEYKREYNKNKDLYTGKFPDTIRAKKSLGQHFLTSKGVVDRMLQTADAKTGEIVLEIGPGKGVMTEALLRNGAVVFAVEKDIDMIALLKEKFADELTTEQLILSHEDILDFSFSKFSEKIKQKNNTKEYKLIANIPYYITGAIIRLFLETDFQPKSMTLLVQKEVAQRTVAHDKKESLLSISVKAYGQPYYIQTIKAGSFFPPPKVDSAILHISNLSKEFFKDIEETKFFEVLHAGFAHKRKILIGNLKTKFPATDWKLVFENADLPQNSRAEDVTLDTWKKLVI